MVWDEGSQEWADSPMPHTLPAADQAATHIQSVVSTAVPVLGTHLAQAGKTPASFRPTSAQLKVLAASTFSEVGGPVLKARFQGCAIPVTVSDAGIMTSPALNAAAGAAAPLHKLRVSLDLSALPPCNGGFQPGLAMLEVWQGRVVLQTVPVLLLTPQQQEMGEELGSLSFDRKFCRPFDTSLHASRVTSMLGTWLGYMAQQPQEALDALAALPRTHCFKDGRDDSAQGQDGSLRTMQDVLKGSTCPDMHACMLAMGRTLLHHAVASAWVHTANELMHQLVGRCGLGFEELYASDVDANTLLRECLRT